MADRTDSIKATIVIDNGSDNTRIGNAGDEAPRDLVPSLVGYSRIPEIEIATDKCGYYIGKKAFSKRGLLNMVNPIVNRRIVDFEAMEKLWHYLMFDSLKSSPDDNSVLLTESCEYTNEDREKLAEIFFEGFNVPSLYLGNQGTLALFSTGSTKGVVLDSGEGGTHVIPIFEGYISPYSVLSSKISGKIITDRLLDLFIQKGITFSRHQDYDLVKRIKEEKCYISLDYDKEITEFLEKANTKDVLYQLPDGQSIKMNREQIEAPQLMFEPNTQENSSQMGIDELLYRSYFSIDGEIRNALFEKIVLCGGNTLFPNISERISKSIKTLGGNSVSFKLHCPAERSQSSWIGGSVLACLSPFESMWVSKQDYEECGPGIINIKRI